MDLTLFVILSIGVAAAIQFVIIQFINRYTTHYIHIASYAFDVFLYIVAGFILGIALQSYICTHGDIVTVLDTYEIVLTDNAEFQLDGQAIRTCYRNHDGELKVLTFDDNYNNNIAIDDSQPARVEHVVVKWKWFTTTQTVAYVHVHTT